MKRANAADSQFSLRWLSLLPFLNAIGTAVGAYMLLHDGPDTVEALGSSPTYLLIGSAFLAILGLVTGVGIWMQRRWGWWLAAYYFVYNGLRSVNALLSFLLPGSSGSGLTRVLLGLVVDFGVAIYLYTPGPLNWFGVTLHRKWPSMLLIFAAAVGIGLFFLGLSLFL